MCNTNNLSDLSFRLSIWLSSQPCKQGRIIDISARLPCMSCSRCEDKEICLQDLPREWRNLLLCVWQRGGEEQVDERDGTFCLVVLQMLRLGRFPLSSPSGKTSGSVYWFSWISSLDKQSAFLGILSFKGTFKFFPVNFRLFSLYNYDSAVVLQMHTTARLMRRRMTTLTT